MQSLFHPLRSRLRALASALGLLAAIGAQGCQGGQGGRGAPAKEAAEKVDPGILLDLSPKLEEDALDVVVRVTGPEAASVKELRVAKAWADTRGADAVRSIEVSDADGPIRVAPPVDDGPDVVYPLTKPPAGNDLRLRYRATGAGTVAVPGMAPSSRLALRLGRGRVSGVGHSFLLLPEISGALPARIRWQLGALGDGAAAATSFGQGADVKTTATTEELAHAMYMAGRLASAEGGQGTRMIMLGNPELDVGAVLDWTVRVDDLARKLFREGAPSASPLPLPAASAAAAAPRPPKPEEPSAPFSFLLVAEPGMGRSHDGAHLTRSLGLWFDEARALDARLRIAITHELLHGYIGASVRLNEESGRDATWFSEGFTTHYARHLLFKEKLISPDDFVEDLRRSLDPAEGREGKGRHEGYSRGALYAAYLDAALKKKSGGLRSLDDVVLGLLAAAKTEGKPALPVSLFRDLVVRELGPEGGEDFDRLIARADRPVEPPPSAFGPCFKRADRKEPMFELGFDPSSLRSDPILIRGLLRGSAAARAGLREGDLVLNAKVPDQSGALPVKRSKTRDVVLTVAGARGGKKVRYKPIGERTVMRWEPKKCKR
jgi:hypothetical protein